MDERWGSHANGRAIDYLTGTGSIPANLPKKGGQKPSSGVRDYICVRSVGTRESSA